MADMVQARAKFALKAGIITVMLSSVLVLIKALAFVFSGSVAVLSSLIDSALDTLLSFMNFCAVYYASRPPDEDHRYGHGKMEGIAALAQSAVIMGGTVFLFIESLGKFVSGEEMQRHMLVIVIMLISVAIGSAIVFIQKRAVKKSASLSIEADSAHYSSDIIMNGAIILVIIAQYLGAPYWLDGLCGLAVSFWLGKLSLEVGQKGVDMILDRELPSSERKKILSIIKAHEQVLGVHDLRAIKSGMSELIMFDIEADPELSLHDAHAITKELEAEILEIFPFAQIMIHVDPHGEIEDSRHLAPHIHH